MSTKVNVGIIGAGRIGKLHAEHLAYHVPDANIIAIADIFLEAAEIFYLFITERIFYLVHFLFKVIGVHI